MQSRFLVGWVFIAASFGMLVGPGIDWVSADEPNESLIIDGNQLKAKPGYVLEKGANGQMIVRRKPGGDSVLTVTCGCSGGTGNCAIFDSGDVAICTKDPVRTCNGKCVWSREGPPSKVAPRTTN